MARKKASILKLSTSNRLIDDVVERVIVGSLFTAYITAFFVFVYNPNSTSSEKFYLAIAWLLMVGICACIPLWLKLEKSNQITKFPRARFGLGFIINVLILFASFFSLMTVAMRLLIKFAGSYLGDTQLLLQFFEKSQEFLGYVM